MLEAFVIAGGSGSKVETFRLQIRAKIIKVEAALEVIRYKGS